MPDHKITQYSKLAEHVRTTLNQDDLNRASNALKSAAEARRRIIHLQRSTPEEEKDARAEIYELIDAPDITKLNKLFRSPINILPKDMKYSEKAVLKAQEYFQSMSARCERATPKSTPESANFDSIVDFEAFSEQLKTANPCKIGLEDKAFTADNLHLTSEIEHCSLALRSFETRFADVNQIPQLPDELNESVHEKIRQLSSIISDIDEFTKAKISTVDRNHRIQESTKTVPGAKINKDIEEIMCQVENLAFPSSCEDEVLTRRPFH